MRDIIAALEAPAETATLKLQAKLDARFSARIKDRQTEQITLDHLNLDRADLLLQVSEKRAERRQEK